MLRFTLNLTFWGLGTILWLAFFSQFILPIQNIQQRVNAFYYLILYVIGRHGQIARIENGQEPPQDARSSRGPGLLILDTASAALLRTPQRFTRVVGPGVVFTEPEEQIADVVDLRLQRQTIGPRDNEDPFAPRRPEESRAEYESRIRRSSETRAVTRDNFEIVPQIEVIFRLDALPGQGNTEFGYNPQSVQQAILGQVVNADLPLETPNRLIHWNQLPAQLAAEAWRDLVSRLTLNDLFPLVPTRQGVSGLLNVIQVINQRLTQPVSPALDATGVPTGNTVPSREFDLLTSRGIRVVSVHIFNIKLRPEVERELLNRWNAGWLTYARQEREQIETLRRALAERARDQAWRIFIETTTRNFAELNMTDLSKTATPPSTNTESNADFTAEMRTILLRLLRGHLALTQERPGLQALTQDEQKQILELITLLESRLI
ncbi:MAG: SPFH domain-containing protein [Thermanaerothrix sp.]|nr:SPFH domain-containing protein [Thermanaerothrix sp.]